MSLSLLNNVAETTTTTGTGSYLLAGVVSAGYRPFADGGNGAVVPYKIENADKTKSEWGLGTYSSGGNTLARSTILGNYLGTTAAIDWAAGTKNIYSPPLKELLSWITFNNSYDVAALKFAESAAPSTPASGFAAIYVKSDGKLYLKDDAGTETDLTAGSTLDSLGDVVITSATNLDLLQFNGTNWINRTIAGAGLQPLDGTLTALAGLTIAANSLSIGSGADAFSQTTFAASTFPARASTGNLVAKTITDFALTILDDVDGPGVRTTIGAGTGSGDALVANTLDQFADVTQTATKTLAITDSTTLAGGTHSGTNTGDQTSVSGNAGTVTVADAGGDTTCFVLLGTAATGSLAPATDAELTYNATTNALTATTFVGSLTGNASGSSGSCTGNAATATALATARNINGVAFDGTANITVTAAGSTLSDTVTVAKGGTGLTALGTALQVLRVNAGGTALEYASPAGGGDALVANPLSQFAATTSAQLAGVISDETGSGPLVFANSPTLVTPALGTPASGTLTNCTIPQAAVTGLTTADSPQFAALNIGHASDTTITRASAGVITVEGVTVDTASNTLTLTNKRITKRVSSQTSAATVTPASDDYDIIDITAQAEALTMAAPSGTPTNGQVLVVRIKDNATARAITWNSAYTICGTILPTTTVVSKRLACIFVYNTANSLNKWELLASNQEA